MHFDILLKGIRIIQTKMRKMSNIRARKKEPKLLMKYFVSIPIVSNFSFTGSSGVNYMYSSTYSPISKTSNAAIPCKMLKNIPVLAGILVFKSGSRTTS